MARHDLAILGGGPGGMSAALWGATRGMDFVLVDGGNFLGYGLHGAYKSKALWEAAKDWISAERLGWACIPEAHGALFDKIHARVATGMTDLTGMYLQYLNRKKIRFVRGFGAFASPHTIEVDGECIEADAVIIATGSRPRLIQGAKVDGAMIMTSDDIVDIRQRFDSLLAERLAPRLQAGKFNCGIRVQSGNGRRKKWSASPQKSAQVTRVCERRCDGQPDGQRVRLARGRVLLVQKTSSLISSGTDSPSKLVRTFAVVSLPGSSRPLLGALDAPPSQPPLSVLPCPKS